MNGLLTIAQLTWLEARRRRIVLAAVICGVVFLAIFATAVFFMPPPNLGRPNALLAGMQLQVMSLVGLYAVNLLGVAFAVMLPVDALSGEIASGVIQTIASKPIRRVDILLGKWIVFWLMLAAYILFMVAGIVAILWSLRGFVPQNLLSTLALMQLEASVLIAITLLGGVYLSTVTNGIVAFAFYVVGFIGSGIEQVGVYVGNATSRYIGTAISLISPTDALWRLAMHGLQPPFLAQVPVSPFANVSVPSMAMVWWAIAYGIVALTLAARGLARRPV